MSQIKISKKRSQFWIIVFKNDESYGVVTNPYSLPIIQYCCPELEDMSPRGWTITENNNRHLWIPADKAIEEGIEDFIQWAKDVNSHIWLKTNKNICDYFSDELFLCVATDWNIDFETRKYTKVGEAEYKIKYCYPRGEISKKELEDYAEILTCAIMNCIKYLPLGHKDSLLVTSIPAEPDKNSLSWNLAKYVCDEIGATMLFSTLKINKQQTKGLSIKDKIQMWNNIYQSNAVELSKHVNSKKVLVVDDLYQSGTSMWSYAKYLKSLGATEVLGLVAVKSQRDSDNQ